MKRTLLIIMTFVGITAQADETYLCVPEHTYGFMGGKTEPLRGGSYQSSEKWLLKFIPSDKAGLDGYDANLAKLKDVWKFKKFKSDDWNNLTRIGHFVFWSYSGVGETFWFNEAEKIFSSHENTTWFLGDGESDVISVNHFGKCSRLD